MFKTIRAGIDKKAIDSVLTVEDKAAAYVDLADEISTGLGGRRVRHSNQKSKSQRSSDFFHIGRIRCAKSIDPE